MTITKATLSLLTTLLGYTTVAHCMEEQEERPFLEQVKSNAEEAHKSFDLQKLNEALDNLSQHIDDKLLKGDDLKEAVHILIELIIRVETHPPTLSQCCGRLIDNYQGPCPSLTDSETIDESLDDETLSLDSPRRCPLVDNAGLARSALACSKGLISCLFWLAKSIGSGYIAFYRTTSDYMQSRWLGAPQNRMGVLINTIVTQLRQENVEDQNFNAIVEELRAQALFSSTLKKLVKRISPEKNDKKIN